jgi:glycosyltransferase involved in cell wall biosynthesis
VTLRVVFVTSSAYLDTALNRIRALSQIVDLHLVLELSPESWRQSFFDLSPRTLPRGVSDASGLLHEALPESVHSYVAGLKSAHLAVFDHPRAFHPRTVVTSQSVTKSIRDLRADIVHLDDSSTRLGWGAWRMGRVPVVMTVNDPLPHSGEGGWKPALSRRLNYRIVDRFILQSRWGVESFSRRYGVAADRIDVSLLGACDVLRDWCGAQPAAVAPSSRPMVLFFGRMSVYKGIDVLVEAAPLMAERVPGLRVVIAGGPVFGFTPPSDRELPNGGSVETIARHVSTDEAVRLFDDASVVVLPYRDATQSGVILSAFAFGKPVVATAVGGLPEYIRDGENGLLVPPGDATALAAAVLRVFDEPRLRDDLHDGVLSSVEGALSWDRIARANLRSYEAAAKEYRRHAPRSPLGRDGEKGAG